MFISHKFWNECKWPVVSHSSVGLLVWLIERSYTLNTYVGLYYSTTPHILGIVSILFTLSYLITKQNYILHALFFQLWIVGIIFGGLLFRHLLASFACDWLLHRISSRLRHVIREETDQQHVNFHEVKRPFPHYWRYVHVRTRKIVIFIFNI